MKLYKDKIDGLLKNGISKKPLMLHGTSVESIIEMFENGILLPGKVCFKDTKDHLFFVPVQDKLKGTKFYKDFDGYTVSFAKESAGMFAEVSAKDWYVIREIEKVVSDPTYAQLIMHDWKYGIRDDIPMKERLKALCLNHKKMYSEAEKRKGVILEMNNNILELGLELDPHPEGLKLYCPDGLGAEYVRGIELLGDEERNIVSNYVRKL